MKRIKNIIDLIDKAIKDEPDIALTWWNIIKDSYDSKVDEYRNILNNSKDWLWNYQKKLIQKTWITNLKIKYTNISGYFIEVPKLSSSKITNEFSQTQTLVNASRYITVELKDFEEKYKKAENFLSSREYEIFQGVRAEILDWYNQIKDISSKISFLDFEVCMSNLAYANNYSRPKLVKNYELNIKSWRHPVIEKIEKNFISNDLDLNKNEFIHIITWPNMWWKSTFLRQNALIILMAHLGGFVPAKQATIPLTDKIFSRVWASDNLYFWQSTFMVEMQEVAYILSNSSKNSFVIIDEVGRGTSTFDWMSLAWAILKENHDKIKAKTLFATHYHELIDESKNLKAVKNFSVAVWENDSGLVFLRKIIAWGIKKSFGLEVAKLAWINNSILLEAQKMLKVLENASISNAQLSIWDLNPQVEEKIIFKQIEKDSIVEKKLKQIDIDSITPIEALSILNNLKSSLK